MSDLFGSGDGLFVDGDAGNIEGFESWVAQCAAKTRTMKQQAGGQRIHRSFDHPSGAICHVVDLEYVRKIYVTAPPSEAQERRRRQWEEQWYGGGMVGVPDYVSGSVTAAVTDRVALNLPGDSKEKHTTPLRDVVRHHTRTDSHGHRIPHDMARYKLGVARNPVMASQSGAAASGSHHKDISPGLYTGAMRPLVQLYLGIGRVRPQTWEQRWLEANPDQAPLSAADTEVAGWVAYEQDEDGAIHRVERAGEASEATPPASAFGLYDNEDYEEEPYEWQLLWDYKAGRTHGVYLSDGQPYLIEIGQRGVLAMAMPLDPVSLTEAGRQRYADLYPELFERSPHFSGRSFFDAFGGFPVGVSMPIATAVGKHSLERAKKAGEVLEMVAAKDMDFYSGKLWYSTATGWAFNPQGNRADNTCWSQDDDGAQTGYHYAVFIKMGAPRTRVPSELAGEVFARLQAMKEAPDGIDQRKTERLTLEQCESLLKITDDGQFRKVFDELQVMPDFSGTARCELQESGRLYHPGRLVTTSPLYEGLSAQPQIKFPEIGTGLISHNFSSVHPETGLVGWLAGDPPECDTPMYVYWRGNALIVLRYSWFPPLETGAYSTRGECQLEGSWTEGEYNDQVWGNFYSTEFDWRVRGHKSRTVTTSTKSYEAPHEVWRYSMTGGSPLVSATGPVYANAYGYTITSERAGSLSTSTSVVIPEYERSAVMVAQYNYLGNNSTYTNIVGGWSGLVYGSGRVQGIKMSKLANTAQNEAEYYFDKQVGQDAYVFNGSAMYEVGTLHKKYIGGVIDRLIFLDNWDEPITPDGRVNCIQDAPPSLPQEGYEPPPVPDRSHYSHQPDKYEWQVVVFGDTHINAEVLYKGDLETNDSYSYYNTELSGWWFKPSPDQNGNIAKTKACINSFGQSLAGIDYNFNSALTWFGGPNNMKLDGCFIGVVE